MNYTLRHYVAFLDKAAARKVICDSPGASMGETPEEFAKYFASKV